MVTYDSGKLAELVDNVRATGRRGTNQAKGQAMTNLVAYIFGEVPGLDLRHRDFLTPDGTSEMDLAFRNRPVVSGLFDGVTLKLECKNERKKISAAEVRIFGSKLRQHNQPVGIMVSRTGLSGKPGTRTDAHGVVAGEMQNGCSIVVLALDDLAELRNAEELVELCVDRRFELENFGTYSTI
jgi:hypothetical protein